MSAERTGGEPGDTCCCDHGRDVHVHGGPCLFDDWRTGKPCSCPGYEWNGEDEVRGETRAATAPVDLDDLDYRLSLYPESVSPVVIEVARRAVAELRTARATITHNANAVNENANQIVALRARIEAARAVVHVMFLGHGEGPSDLCDRCADRERLRAALSGVSELAAEES